MELVALVDAGWSGVALESLRARHQVVVEHRDESCLVLASRSDLAEGDLPWAKSHFTVLARTYRAALERSMFRLADEVPDRLDLGREARKGFRIVVHVDGALHSVDDRARSRLESAVATASGASVSRRGGGAEIWVLGRRESDTVWLLNRAQTVKRRPPKGALSAEMASLLCLASSPDPRDLFLDPFAGTGAIALARRSWPATAIYASDQKKIAWHVPAPDDVVTLHRSIQDLADVIPRGVSVVVTDPPWNEFSVLHDFDKFLLETCASLANLAHPSQGLRVVLLMTRRHVDQLDRSLDKTGFRQIESDPVLVNGHPASVVTARL